jgi:hypothetical protein
VSTAPKTKAELEAERLERYLAKADAPAPLPLTKPAAVQPQIEDEPPAALAPAQKPLETPAAPAHDSAPVETVEKPPAARKTAPAKKKDPMPWEGMPDVDTAKFSMTYSTRLDAKMKWINEHAPGGFSKQKQVKQALAEWVEKKLRELQK